MTNGDCKQDAGSPPDLSAYARDAIDRWKPGDWRHDLAADYLRLAAELAEAKREVTATREWLDAMFDGTIAQEAARTSDGN
jgi:hypothetical protein